jgi:alpha-L-fucosidase
MMRKYRTAFFGIVFGCVFSLSVPVSMSAGQDEPGLKQRLEWFQDLKFGLFVHFGIYSQWGCIESWPLIEADKWARPDDLPAWKDRGYDIERFKADYWKLNETFNPVNFNPEEWAQAAEQAGMKYFVFTTKHHDGFSMFDTRQTDYRITHASCPFSRQPRADITLESFNAFRRKGFAIGAYFSKADWHSPDFWIPGVPARTRQPNYDPLKEPARWQRFVDFVHNQVKELTTGYGPIDILWLDAGWVRPPAQDLDMDRLVAMARSSQPGLIVVDRTVGGKHENYRTPEQEVPAQPPDYVWETCMTMGDQWSFHPEDNYKSTHDLIHLLVDIVSKGGNFLLNVGPGPDGRLPRPALDRLREIGNWMQVNSEAIYGTRAIAPYRQDRVRFTSKPEWIYAIYGLEADSSRLPGVIQVSGLKPAAGQEVFMLGYSQSLPWRAEQDGFRVEIPKKLQEKGPSLHAVTLKWRRTAAD